MKVDVFKNRNIHLWFTNKELLKQINQLLLEYYKPVEGDVDTSAPGFEAPLFHQTPARNYGEFFSSPEVAAAVIGRAQMYGREDVCGSYREQWKPSRVLEPSAGGGILAEAARAKGHHVTCVEIQGGHAAMLRRAGFETREADFLKLRPSDFPELFDYVVMNPPFDRGRDCDHVRHAMEFLKPGGTLVSVMSARAEFAEDARHKALHALIERNGGSRYETWQDLPDRSFAHAGTNVNTVMLKIIKRRA